MPPGGTIKPIYFYELAKTLKATDTEAILYGAAPLVPTGGYLIVVPFKQLQELELVLLILPLLITVTELTLLLLRLMPSEPPPQALSMRKPTSPGQVL